MSEKYLAAVDMGTNSFHLVVVRADDAGHFEIVGREKESVRLGSGAGDLETITPEAMERGIAVLARYGKIASSMNAPLRAVATSAVREAHNKDDFLRKVKEKTGLEPEVIPGHEEARLIYMGMLQALPVFDRKILMIDIGGGSTEFLIGRGAEVAFAVSLKLGAIRLKDRFFSREPLTKSQVEECRKFLQIQLTGVRDEAKKHSFEMAVGSSGTIETLAELISPVPQESGETRHRDLAITKKDLDQIVEKILSYETARKRQSIPGLDEKRADIIVGGAVLLQEIFAALSIEKMTVSPYALREGVIYDTLLREERRADLGNIRRSSVLHLLNSFSRKGYTGSESSKHSAFLALRFFHELKRLKLITDLGESDAFLLESAVLLHNIGLIISHSGHHKHSYYIIKNSELLMGFTSQEIEIISLLARYHRKAPPSKKHVEFQALDSASQKKLTLLEPILRISIGLDRSGSQSVQDLSLEIDGAKLRCNVTPAVRNGVRQDIALELWAAKMKSELFEKTYGRSVDFFEK